MSFGSPQLRSEGDLGFTLLELSIGLLLTALLITVQARCLLTVWEGVDRWREHAEVQVMWSSVKRWLGADLHAAHEVRIDGSQLTITTVDGDTYRYVTNPAGQLVRVAANGGSTVVAAMVEAVQWSTAGTMTTCTVHFLDDSIFTSAFAATLAGGTT